MWVPVIMHDEDPFDSPTHAEILIVVLQALQTRCDAGVLLGLGFLRTTKTRNERQGRASEYESMLSAIQNDRGFLT